MMFDWLPMVFIFSHLFFFLTGVWIIHFKDSILPVFMASSLSSVSPYYYNRYNNSTSSYMIGILCYNGIQHNIAYELQSIILCMTYYMWTCTTNITCLCVCVCVRALQYIVVISVTILMDIIQLGLYFSDNQDVFGGGDSQTARTWQFSAAVMIISLMMKPLTIALACVAAYLKFGSHLSGK